LNQTLVQILCKMVQDSKKDWSSNLTWALWTYKTTYKVTTFATPSSLVYGIEVIYLLNSRFFISYYYNKKFDESQSLKDRVEWFEWLDKARHLIVQRIEIM